MKKIIFLKIIAVCFCLFTITSAFAQGGTVGPLTWQITGTGNNLTLTISGSGEMPDLPLQWSSYRPNIRTIIIGNSVTKID